MAKPDIRAEKKLLSTLMSEARRQPFQFALLQSKDGLVLCADRRKSVSAMKKEAKAGGGGARGAWGSLRVDGRKVILECEEDPPGSLEKAARKHFSDRGQSVEIEIRAVAPPGSDVAPEWLEDPAPEEPDTIEDVVEDILEEPDPVAAVETMEDDRAVEEPDVPEDPDETPEPEEIAAIEDAPEEVAVEPPAEDPEDQPETPEDIAAVQEDTPEDKPAATAEAVATARNADPETTEEEALDPDGPDSEDDVAAQAGDLAALMKAARRRPYQFAWLKGSAGMVLKADRRMAAEKLVKRARSEGCGPKGAWGSLSVDGRTVVLECEELPSKAIARQARMHLLQNDIKAKIVMRTPGGDQIEEDEDPEDNQDDAFADLAQAVAAETDEPPSEAALEKLDLGDALEDLEERLGPDFQNAPAGQEGRLGALRQNLDQAIAAGDLAAAREAAAEADQTVLAAGPAPGEGGMSAAETHLAGLAQGGVEAGEEAEAEGDAPPAKSGKDASRMPEAMKPVRKGTTFYKKFPLTGPISSEDLLLQIIIANDPNVKSVNDAKKALKTRRWRESARTPLPDITQEMLDKAEKPWFVWYTVNDGSIDQFGKDDKQKLKGYYHALDGAEKSRINMYANRKYQQIMGEKLEEGLDPSNPEHRRKMREWSDIQRKALEQHLRLANLPDDLKAFLFDENSKRPLRPEHYGAALKMAERAQYWSKEQRDEFKARSVYSTTDANRAYMSLVGFEAEMAARDDARSRRSDAARKIKGSTKLFDAREAVRTSRNEVNVMSWGRLDTYFTVLEDAHKAGKLDAVAKEVLDQMIPFLDDKMEAAVKAKIKELKELGYSRFNSLDAYQDKVKVYEEAFEDEAIHLANEFFDRSEKVVVDQWDRYSDQAAVDDAVRMATEFRTLILSKNGDAKSLMAAATKLGQAHPIFKDPTFPMGDVLEEKDPKKQLLKIRAWLSGKRKSIRRTRRAMKKDNDLVWRFDGIQKLVLERTSEIDDPLYPAVVADRVRREREEDAAGDFALMLLALGAGLLSGGSGALAILAGAAAFGLDIYDLDKQMTEYSIDANAHRAGALTEAPSVAGVVLSVSLFGVGNAFEVAGFAAKGGRAIDEMPGWMQPVAKKAEGFDAAKTLDDKAAALSDLKKAAGEARKAGGDAKGLDQIIEKAEDIFRQAEEAKAFDDEFERAMNATFNESLPNGPIHFDDELYRTTRNLPNPEETIGRAQGGAFKMTREEAISRMGDALGFARLGRKMVSIRVRALMSLMGEKVSKHCRTAWYDAMARTDKAKQVQLMVEQGQEVSYELAESAYSLVQQKFWEEVYKNQGMVQRLQEAGLTIEGKRAPYLVTPDGKEHIFSLEHFVRKSDVPAKALDPDNLIFSFARENSGVLEAIRLVATKYAGVGEDFIGKHPWH